MTKEGIELIKRFEGFRTKAYKCSAGVWTIGYGATYYMDGTKVKEGDTITEAKAEELLNWMVEVQYGASVNNLVKVYITPYQHDALTSFAYNVGSGNLKTSTLLKKVNKNPEDPSIANEFAKWNKCNGKELAGLTRRRKAESELYFKEWIEPSVEDDEEETVEPKTEPEVLPTEKEVSETEPMPLNGHFEPKELSDKGIFCKKQ